MTNDDEITLIGNGAHDERIMTMVRDIHNLVDPMVMNILDELASRYTVEGGIFATVLLHNHRGDVTTIISAAKNISERMTKEKSVETAITVLDNAKLLVETQRVKS